MIQSNECKVMSVIVNTKLTRGKGEEVSDPVRTIIQISELDGTLIVENDPFKKYSAKDIIDFIAYRGDKSETQFTDIYLDIDKYFNSGIILNQ